MNFCKPPKRATHPEAYKLWRNTEKRYQRQLVKADLASLSHKKRSHQKFIIKRRFVKAYQKELAAIQQPQPGVPSGMGGEGGGLMGPGVTSSTVSAASQSVVRNGGGQVRHQVPVEFSIGGMLDGEVGGMLDGEVGPVSHQKPVEISGGIPMFVDIGRQEPVEMEITQEERDKMDANTLTYTKLKIEQNEKALKEQREDDKELVEDYQGYLALKKQQAERRKVDREEARKQNLLFISEGEKEVKETAKKSQTPKKRAPTTELESVSDVSDREEEEEEEAMEEATQKEVAKAKAVAKKVSFMVTPKKPKATPKKASAKKAKDVPKSKPHVVETRSARKSRTPSHFRDFEMES